MVLVLFQKLLTPTSSSLFQRYSKKTKLVVGVVIAILAIISLILVIYFASKYPGLALSMKGIYTCVTSYGAK